MLGITRVIVRYSGSGDSGAIDEVEFLDDRDCKVAYDPDVHYPVHMTRTNLATGHDIGILQHKPLAEVAEDLAWNAIDGAGEDGFYNNEGGYGTFTINLDCSPVKIELNHVNYIQLEERFDTTWESGNPMAIESSDSLP